MWQIGLTIVLYNCNCQQEQARVIWEESLHWLRNCLSQIGLQACLWGIVLIISACVSREFIVFFKRTLWFLVCFIFTAMTRCNHRVAAADKCSSQGDDGCEEAVSWGRNSPPLSKWMQNNSFPTPHWNTAQRKKNRYWAEFKKKWDSVLTDLPKSKVICILEHPWKRKAGTGCFRDP